MNITKKDSRELWYSRIFMHIYSNWLHLLDEVFYLSHQEQMRASFHVSRTTCQSWYLASALMALSILACAPSLQGLMFLEENDLQASRDLFSSLQQDPRYGAVGWIEIEEGPSRFRGTGIAINQSWILTAGHNWIAEAVTGLSFHLPGQPSRSSSGEWIQHPSWREDPAVGLGQGWDIGLFKLTEPLDLNIDVRIYSGFEELGQEVLVMGTGLSGKADGVPQLRNEVLVASNTIDRASFQSGESGSGGLLGFDFDDGTLPFNSLAGTGVPDVSGFYINPLDFAGGGSSNAPTTLEGTTLLGDSGGPAFADFGQGPELIGLVSWGVNPTNLSRPYAGGVGDVTYLTRLSAHRDWILSVIPEPSVLCLAGLGLCVLVILRRSIA